MSILLQEQFQRWRKVWRLSETTILAASALLVGLTSGIGIWIFKRLIDLAQFFFFGIVGAGLTRYSAWLTFLVPVMGGAVVGLISHFLIGEERFHGVSGIMKAVAFEGGRLRYKRVPLKAIASAISIGAGAAVGPEDPSVQIGANLGSMFGQWLDLPDDRIRSLVAAGAASGIAAAFNAPITGLFFAMEIILGDLGGRAFGFIGLAAVMSTVFTQAVSGTQPAFRIPAYAFNSPWELPLYFGLGLIAGPTAALYAHLLYTTQDIFNAWSVPRWLKPMVAGLIVGIIGIFLPQVFGTGYRTIEQVLVGELPTLTVLLMLLVARLILTPISIGGGFFGGVFAPSLFIGAMLGAAYGVIARALFPSLHVIPSAFALVGMAAVLAGAVHAPLTAILLLFEMTGDYRIVLPLIFATTVSLVISRRLQKDAIYTLGLARAGIRLERRH